MQERVVAISVKQPWAALLAAGRKTIEIRTWKTHRRGRVFIHASKIPDPRPEGWALIDSPRLEELARLRGGLIGVGELVDCRRYTTPEDFAAAAPLHCNSAHWFVATGLYGFVFQDLHPIAYHACPGQTLFFSVEGFSAHETHDGIVD
jgi:hypothetical protein